jgi:CBS domain-containing protein
MQAQDVMTTKVVSVGPDTPVQEIAGLLLEHNIRGTVVLDADGRLIGIVTQQDLFHLLAGEEEGAGKRTWWSSLVGTDQERAHEHLKLHGRVAREIMTTPVVTVGPATPVTEVARLLETRRIERVPVVADGRVVGIVTRRDLLRALALQPTVSPVTADDRGRCRQVEAKLSQAGLDWRHHVNVVVTDGTVHLWGVAVSADEAALYRRLAEEVAGADRVESHLSVRDADPRLRPGSRYGLS